MNSKLLKMCGQPKNVSDNTGGRKTQAESMPAIDSNIAGKHFIGKCTATYGVNGVGK
jgi:hypothetical protein